VSPDKRTGRRLTVIGIVLFAMSTALMAASAGGVTGVAATGPTLTVTPNTGIADGQYVLVDFSGFAPSSGLSFRECIAAPVTIATDCTATNPQVTGVADTTGAGSTYLPIYADDDPLLLNAAGTGLLTCDVKHPCSIAAIPPPGTDLTGAAIAQLSFEPSPSACPPPGPNDVLGGGASSAWRAMYLWESTACTAPNNLSVTYDVSNSPEGVTNFLLSPKDVGHADFAVTGPFAPAFTPASTTVTWKYAPVTSSAIVVAYRIYDRRGQQITKLVLTPDLIAQIFLGQIPNWTVDKAITKLNKGVQFPARIAPFARADNSEETYAFTSWLAATAPSWTAGPQEIFPFPPSGDTGVTGSDFLAQKVVNPQTDFFDQGNIGFMDSSTAAFYGLPTVEIKRADGSVTPATPATIAQAITDATVNADGTLDVNYATTDPVAYPLPLVSYLMAPTNTIAGNLGITLAAFLRYAVQQGQTILPPGYVPLPANLVAESTQAASLIPDKAPPPPPPPPKPKPKPLPVVIVPQPTPVPTPTPTPAPVSCTSVPPATQSPAPVTVTPAASLTAASTGCPPPAPVTPVFGPLPAIPVDQSVGLAGLAGLENTAAGRTLLPSIAIFGLLLILSGASMQALGRRRSTLPAGKGRAT
jgi:phosphate transport system substrate-binding protein